MRVGLAALLFCFFSLPVLAEAPLSDEALLDLIQKQSFDYFVFEQDPGTGLVRDRAPNQTGALSTAPASIAATGFALTAYPVAVERNWMDAGEAKKRTLATLNFFRDQAAQERGFFYHFMDMKTGRRIRNSELSPIDTTLLLAGILFAAEYYDDSEIRKLANEIYERVDWAWMTNGGKTLAMAWSPENGFSKHRWDHYCESMIMYLLAIGSPTHPIPAESWRAVRLPVGRYKDYKVIQMPPLFTHQYSHLWVDFRDKNDGRADYFKNSVNATLAHRAFAIDQAPQYKTYGPDSWGHTASDGPTGYRAYGAPPGWANHDGTIAPTACGSSIVFTPKESMACLRHFYETHKAKLWGRYGFADAFNLDPAWVSPDVIGIDQGPLMLMIENHRTGLIWEKMKKNTYLTAAMKAVGFKEGTLDLPWPEPPQVLAPYVWGGIEIDGYLRDWPNVQTITLDETYSRSGDFKKGDLKGELGFAWDENYLYVFAKVEDDHVIVRKTGRSLYIDDALEIFIDPAGDGFFWKNPEDFQIGLRVHAEGSGTESWAWFQDENPAAAGGLKAAGFAEEKGYLLEAAIAWRYLGVRPEAGQRVKLTPAIHDIDRDRSEGKFEWFMRSEGEILQFELGTVLLEKKAES